MEEMVGGAVFIGISDLLTGLLLVLVSIPLIRRKVAPNKWYGVRIPKAYTSDSNWYAINALGGRWMAAAGILLALTGAVVLLWPPATLTGVLIASLAPVPLVLLTLVPVLRFARRLPG
ncbi:MAG: SdpI family protein [Thermoanaerobaculia bacterium]